MMCIDAILYVTYAIFLNIIIIKVKLILVFIKFSNYEVSPFETTKSKGTIVVIIEKKKK